MDRSKKLWVIYFSATLVLIIISKFSWKLAIVFFVVFNGLLLYVNKIRYQQIVLEIYELMGIGQYIDGEIGTINDGFQSQCCHYFMASMVLSIFLMLSNVGAFGFCVVFFYLTFLKFVLDQEDKVNTFFSMSLKEMIMIPFK